MSISFPPAFIHSNMDNATLTKYAALAASLNTNTTNTGYCMDTHCDMLKVLSKETMTRVLAMNHKDQIEWACGKPNFEYLLCWLAACGNKKAVRSQVILDALGHCDDQFPNLNVVYSLLGMNLPDLAQRYIDTFHVAHIAPDGCEFQISLKIEPRTVNELHTVHSPHAMDVPDVEDISFFIQKKNKKKNKRPVKRKLYVNHSPCKK